MQMHIQTDNRHAPHYVVFRTNFNRILFRSKFSLTDFVRQQMQYK